MSLMRFVSFGVNNGFKVQNVMNYPPSKRFFSTRVRATIKERLEGSRLAKEPTNTTFSQPAAGTATQIGRGAVAIGSVLALGGLCYYGVAPDYGASALDRASSVWPDYVRQRIHSTYGFFGSGVALTGAFAIASFRNKTIMRIATQGGWMSLIGGLVLMVGSSMVTMALPYPESGLSAKHLAWVVHSGIVGAVIAPICFVGGPILTRAALYTVGIVGSLSALAATAPSEKFLMMGGPLAIGLGVVFVSSLGGMFFSPLSALGSGLYAISMYGGLVLFSGFLLYDTQKIIYLAENHPNNHYMMDVKPFDPINASMGIYMDTINIFIRMAALLSGNRKK